MLLLLMACFGPAPVAEEICDNGVDDDQNGRVDGDDFACGDDDSVAEPGG